MATNRRAKPSETRRFGSPTLTLVVFACLAVSSPAHARWTTSTAVDNLSGNPFVVASAYAHQSESGNPKDKAIHVRCKGGKIDVYVDWGRPIDMDFGMRVRCDRHNPIDLRIAEADDPKIAFVRANAEERQRLLGLLRRSNNLAITLYDWPGRPVRAQFSLEGSNKAIGNVTRLCNRLKKQQVRDTDNEIARYQDQYEEAILNAVRRNWVRPSLAPGEVKCRVRVKKFPDGEVITAKVESSCGSADLDESVIDAVYRASPFPKPRHRSLLTDELTFEFSSSR